MSMQITLQDAYAEACQALGEQIVERRLIGRTADESGTKPAATRPAMDETQTTTAPPNEES